jgi:hypothetical protein
VTILTDARVVQDDQVPEGGWVRWEGGFTTGSAEDGAAVASRPRAAPLPPARRRPHGGGRRGQGLPVAAATRAAATTPAAVLYRGSWVDGRTP